MPLYQQCLECLSVHWCKGQQTAPSDVLAHSMSRPINITCELKPEEEVSKPKPFKPTVARLGLLESSHARRTSSIDNKQRRGEMCDQLMGSFIFCVPCDISWIRHSDFVDIAQHPSSKLVSLQIPQSWSFLWRYESHIPPLKASKSCSSVPGCFLERTDPCKSLDSASSQTTARSN